MSYIKLTLQTPLLLVYIITLGGAHISVYADEARSSIANLRNIINADQATLLLEKAISSKWDKNPIWVHGDFASGNILVKDNRLEAVIDFGCMGSCMRFGYSLDIFSWCEARKIFKSAMNLDNRPSGKVRKMITKM